MREAELTTFLVQNLQRDGIKKLMNLNSSPDIRFHREVGNSAFVADICISINSCDEEEFNNRKVRFVAIEVKISDWENGLYQAWRYNNFAEKSFLAIYKPYAERVNLEEFVNNNVGLIIFDENSFDVVRRPKTNKFRSNTYEMGVRKKMWGTCLSNAQSVCPA